MFNPALTVFCGLQVGAFNNGSLIVVTPMYSSALDHAADFCQQTRVRDLVFVMDEADAFFRHIPNSLHGAASKLSRAELAFYRLVGDEPLQQGSRLRALYLVSATHLASDHWLHQMGLPAKAYLADLQKLEQRGYSSNQNVYLNPTGLLTQADITKENEYGFNHPLVVDKFQRFSQDSRPERLMLVVLTPMTDAPQNLFE